MNRNIKIIGLLLPLVTLSGCGNKPSPSPTPDPHAFKLLLGAKEGTITIAPNATTVLDVNKSIESNNYLQLLIQASNHIKGKFNYVNLDDEEERVSEEFFIEKNEKTYTDFRQFLDAYRPDNQSKGNFDKKLVSVELFNMNDTSVDVKFGGLNYSDYSVPEEEKQVYIEKDNLKVGMDLLTGGTLTYLEKTQYDDMSVDEVIDVNNNVSIGLGLKDTVAPSKVISSHVNLINIYDAGREIQQSYYAAVGGHGLTEAERQALDNPDHDGGTQNGYTRNISKTANPSGYYWPYNPVQGGDEKVNFSQVIDYQVTSDTLYVKVRALDWAANGSGGHGNPAQNRVTKSYIENWYHIENGLLFAKNRFIDWNGFTDLETVPGHNIEMPATYIAQALHNFVTYNGTKPWDLKDETYDRQGSLGPWKYGSYQTKVHPEDWFAWVNNNDFGVGVYIPGATYYASGRSVASPSINEPGNASANKSPMAGKYRYNKPECTSQFECAYTSNTCYTAPVKNILFKNYTPLEYTYAVAVDFVKIFRQQFKDIFTEKKIDNSSLDNWGI